MSSFFSPKDLKYDFDIKDFLKILSTK